MYDVECRAAAGDHCELRLKTLQIELADHALMALLDQEAPRARLQFFLDEPEIPLRKAASAPVVLGIRVRIWEEHLGGRLLNQGAADRATQHVARALCGERHHAVQLAPGLGPILGEVLECRVGQEAPELIHPAHQSPAIQEMTHQVKEVKRHGRSAHLVVEKIRHVEPDDGVT